VISINIRVPSRQQELTVMLEALVKLNRLQLRRAGRLPDLYHSGLRYRREARDPRTGQRREHWRTIGEVMDARGGDCEDLVSARVALLRERGINAKPWLKRAGPRMWHVLVKYPDGRIEDPSKRLGMKAAA